MPCHIFLRENKASIILATAWNLCSEATIFSLQAEIFIKSRTVQLCQGHDFQTAPATRLTDMFTKLPLWKETFPRPKPKRLVCTALMGCALAMRACLALDPQSCPSAQEFIRQMNSWAPSGLRLLVLDGRHEFHGKRGRFSILLCEVSPAVLDHLQQDAEAIRQGALCFGASCKFVSRTRWPRTSQSRVVRQTGTGRTRHIEWPKASPGPPAQTFSVCGCFQEAERKAVQQFWHPLETGYCFQITHGKRR